MEKEQPQNYASQFDQQLDREMMDQPMLHSSQSAYTKMHTDAEANLSTAPNSIIEKQVIKQKTKSEKQDDKKSTARLDNYNMLYNLGEGAYGSVNLAMEKKSGKQVAIKAVNIMKICQLNKERHILREKDLLDQLRFKHANIINLLSTFKVS